MNVLQKKLYAGEYEIRMSEENDCEEHFQKDFCFQEDVTFSVAESIQKKHMITVKFELR